jgi:lysophospholipase L1-like esterase
MGSSFAAGPGILDRAPGSPRRAGRSASNYAHLIAKALDLELCDVTYSGATTGDILHPSAAGQPAQAAQADAVVPGTRLVTLTAGGNDVGYLPRLTPASLPWPLRALPPVTAVENPGRQLRQQARDQLVICHRECATSRPQGHRSAKNR